MGNLGKLGRKAIKLTAKATPIVGSLIDNVESDKGGKGKIHWESLAYSIVRIALTLLAGKYGVDIVI